MNAQSLTALVLLNLIIEFNIPLIIKQLFFKYLKFIFSENNGLRTY